MFCNCSKTVWWGALLALILAISVWPLYSFLTAARSDSERHPLQPDAVVTAEAEAVLAERQTLDETVWSAEVTAQKFEQTFVDLWDRLRQTGHALETAKTLPFGQVLIGKPGKPRLVEADVSRIDLDGSAQAWSHDQWAEKIDSWRAAGYRLVQSEWHHAKFDLKGSVSQTPSSQVSFALHVEHPGTQRRFIVKGVLNIEWSLEVTDKGLPVPRVLAADNVQVLLRTSTHVPFQPLPALATADLQCDGFAAIYDLNRDGRLDIVLGPNTVLYNRGDTFERSEISPQNQWQLSCGVLADFDNDGWTDLLSGSRHEPLRLYRGTADGRFHPEPIVIEAAGTLTNPSTITAGDIDGDHDLDVWVGQYKYPYVKGQMPSPYYDANDGYPAFLLINDGKMKFRDATQTANLADKRLRRTYSSSLVDLDEDGDLDLLVNSDFSGIDLYRNDGTGKFQDHTRQWVDEPHNFGMSHTFGDYDLDGRLDFYVAGMSSTTARRLESLGLGRDRFPEHQLMRLKMGYGNRMYLARVNGHYEEPAFRDIVARTGWSWGTTSFDMENDGDRDIYVANGHVSGRTAKDYCTKFWCHDIYTGTSQSSQVLDLVFKNEAALKGISWNGFEHNALLMNAGGSGFVETGFLAGLAVEFDSRAIVSGDLDGDGKVDLLVAENGDNGLHKVHVLKNSWKSSSPAHWIGVRVHANNSRSPIGATVTAKTAGGRTHIHRIITGDSFGAQHSNQVHFGLGSEDKVVSLTVGFQDGTKRAINNPPVNRYYDIKQLQ